MEPPRKNSDQKPEHATGVGKLYDCTFCKHGFTNAQALGGHMNIHRKDKVVAKVKELETHDDEDDVINNTRYFPQTHHDQAHQIISHHRPVDYQVFLPSSNPSSKPDHHVEENLTSLRIRSVDDHGSIDKLDLELRLGNDHW